MTLMEAAGQGQTTARSPGGLQGHTVRLAPSKMQEQQQQEPQGTAEGTMRRAGSADDFMVDLGLGSAISQPLKPSVEHLMGKKIDSL